MSISRVKGLNVIDASGLLVQYTAQHAANRVRILLKFFWTPEGIFCCHRNFAT